MTPVVILTVVAALGIEVGWEPLAEGGHEYTIQIEPQLLDLLRQGKEIVSEVPPQLHITRYRVTVGTQKLAQVDGDPQPTRAASQPANHTPQNADLRHTDSRQAQAAPEAPPWRAEPAGAEHVQHDPAENPFTHAATDSPPVEHAADNHSKAPAFSGLEPAEGPVDEQAAAEPPPADHPPAKHRASQPGMLAPISTGSKEIEPAAHHEKERVDTEKPSLPAVHHAQAEPARPWIPLMIALVLLFCSLGANAYLGWVAAEARRGQRDALAKFRAAGV
jgi:hypothetical protein